jgi:hypothetical protein
VNFSHIPKFEILGCDVELSMYDIIYKPRMTIKAQTLSDFVAEWTETLSPPKEQELEYWTINFVESLQLQVAGARILVTSPKFWHSRSSPKFLSLSSVD